MKKLIYGLFFLTLLGCGLMGCEKNQNSPQETKIKNNESIDDQSVIYLKPTYTPEDISLIIDHLTDNQYTRVDGFWAKVKKWFKNHAGTHLFSNCEGAGGCGPCPGICFGGIIDNNDGDTVTTEDYSDGLRAFGLMIAEDKRPNSNSEEVLLFMFYKDVENFVTDDYFYIEKNTEANSTICGSMGKDNIKFIKGKYPVIFDSETGYYYSLVDAEMNY